MSGKIEKHIRSRFQLQPLPGNWYVDKAGVLFKVKALVFENGRPDHAIVDYPRGARLKVPLRKWRHFIYQASIPVSSKQQA